jgi:hypothetical protein
MQFPLTLDGYQAFVSSMWNPHGSLSNLPEIDRILFVRPLIAIVNLLGGSTLTLAKVVLFGIPTLAGLSAYALANALVKGTAPEISVGKRATIATVVAVGYAFSPWVMYSASAYFYLLSYALTPLIILLVYRAVTGSRAWPLKALLAGLLYAVASASPQFTAFLGVGCLATAVLGLHHGRAGRRGLAGLGLFLATFTATSLYWLLPTFELARRGHVEPGYLPDWSDTIIFSRNANLPSVLTGYSEWVTWWRFPEWWPDLLTGYWRMATFLAPIAAMVFAFRHRRDWRVRAAFCVGVLATITSLGANSPAAPLYRHLMFGSVFSDFGWFIRAPEKFAGYLWLAILALVTIGSAHLLRAKPLKSRAFLAWVAGAGIAFCSVLPKTLDGFANQYVPVSIPSYYAATAQWLGAHVGPTLWMAPYQDGTKGPAGTVSYAWAPTHQAPFFAAESMPGTVFGDYHFPNYFAREYSYLYNHTDHLFDKLQTLGIQHLVLANDILGGEEGYNRVAAAVAADPRFRLSFSDGPINVYVVPPAFAATDRLHMIRVQGGHAAVDDYLDTAVGGTSATHLVYLQQDRNAASTSDDRSAFGGTPFLLDDSGSIDLAMNTLQERYGTSLISGTDQSEVFHGWGRLLTAEPTAELYPWHTFITQYLSSRDAWDFDYGRGVVITVSPGEPISAPTPNQFPAGHYELLVRGLRSPASTSVTISIGRQSRVVDLSATTATMGWVDAGPIDTSAPTSRVALRSSEGPTVVNLVALVPSREWASSLSAVNAQETRDGVGVVTRLNPGSSVPFPVVGGSYRVVSDRGVALVRLNDMTLQAPGSVQQSLPPGQYSALALEDPRAVATATLSDPHSMVQRIPLGSSCPSFGLVGRGDFNDPRGMTVQARFLDGRGLPIGGDLTLAALAGWHYDAVVSGAVNVPAGATSAQLGLSGAAQAAGLRFIAMCGRAIASPSRLAITPDHWSDGGAVPATAHVQTYDPDWARATAEGRIDAHSLPLDGAINAIPMRSPGDRVVYEPDNLLRRGWLATAFATLFVVVVALACYSRIVRRLVARVWRRPRG